MVAVWVCAGMDDAPKAIAHPWNSHQIGSQTVTAPHVSRRNQAQRWELPLRRTQVALLSMLALPIAAHAQVATSVTACPAERAVYTMTTEDSMHVVHLVPAHNRAGWYSDLYLRLTTAQRDYWFEFVVSASKGNMSLTPVASPYESDARADGPMNLIEAFRTRWPDAPLGDLQALLKLYVLDTELRFVRELPRRGQSAPQYILMPELNTALWYHLPALTEDPRAERDPMPRGMFQLSGCRDAPLPAAFP